MKLITITAIAASLTSLVIAQDTVNGFKLTDLRIDREAIKSGGPPRNGIPSIDAPKFIAPDKADFMRDDDIVLSFTHDGTTRAYPLRILVWHEIVNETINGKPTLVTYCPLCGTAMIFDRKVGGKVRTFGVSGMLYQSDVLMYDREDESLWSQLKMEAVSGPLSGTKLEWLPSEHLTWKAWKAKYPKGEVLSTEAGHQRNYLGHAYASYFGSPNVMFPVPKHRDELLDKAWVVGVVHQGRAVAFPITRLEQTNEAEHAGVHLKFDPVSRLATATDAKGNELPTVTVFWFAWQAFYPQTTLWKP
ncbi:MAG: DUF3179 domain-containing protein [Luteolibacter sp.]|nr:DUF3179 domain-containing protein [Luteolibacter sp.]